MCFIELQGHAAGTLTEGMSSSPRLLMSVPKHHEQYWEKYTLCRGNSSRSRILMLTSALRQLDAALGLNPPQVELLSEIACLHRINSSMQCDIDREADWLVERAEESMTELTTRQERGGFCSLSSGHMVFHSSHLRQHDSPSRVVL